MAQNTVDYKGLKENSGSITSGGLGEDQIQCDFVSSLLFSRSFSNNNNRKNGKNNEQKLNK